MLKTLLVLEGKDYERIVPALFAYMFDRISMEDFIKHVGNRAEGTRIKDIARASGYVMKNCKLYAYACHTARTKGDKLPTRSSFGIDAEDAPLLKRLNLRHLNPKHYRAYSLAEFDAVVASALHDLRNYIGKFVSKKMRFLMDSYAEPRGDIEADMRGHAIASMYKQYPRYESYLHMINVAKAQIHNKGQSFITSSTTKSRNRLMVDAHGVPQAVNVQIDSVVEAVPDAVSYANELKERLTALAQIENKLPERTRLFLMAAMGQPNAGFSEFLNCDNVEAVEAMGWERYMSKLHTFFNTTPARTAVVYDNINKLIHRTGHGR